MKDSILRGDMMILSDDPLTCTRLFRLLFRDNPQSLPRCTEGFVYQCGGQTWRHVPKTEAERTKVPIYKATDVFKALRKEEQK